MNWLKQNWPWLVFTVAIAAVVHVGLVIATPRVIMWRTMTTIARVGHGYNTIAHARRPTATSRGIVRPSPDLLYSTCVFDLDAAGGALRVHARGMPRTYWSVSAFDDDTNNFFVENDRQAKGGVDFIIAAPGHYVDTTLPVVAAPSVRGLVLFRTLINDETRLAEIDQARRGAACEPFKG
jgi:uncharacterized membrane protein